jgi:glycosyltransferase involved in cell wall biosynthesis
MSNNPADAIYDYEVAFGPVIEELEPALIHAHDFHMIGIAVTAANNLRRSGHATKVVYDAHELLEGLDYPPGLKRDWLREESSHIHEVDAVVGVSPVQTTRLRQRYRLDAEPTVVLNAPVVDPDELPRRTIRDDVGVPGKILVYHGTANRQRGVMLIIEALGLLPDDVHAAFVLQPGHALIPELLRRSEELGVSDRVHFLEFVPSAHVSPYLSTADLSVIPLLPTGNHHKTLPNKLFEALQAGLPVLASDMEATAEFIAEYRIGRTFEPGSVKDLAAVAQQMLADLESYRSNITDEVKLLSNWDSQAATLVALYARLLDRPSGAPVHISARDVEERTEHKPVRTRDQTRVAIGPRNMAGQAYMIATAIQTNLGIPALSFAIEREGILDHPIHQRIPREIWRDSTWQLRQRADLASGFSHVLTESGTGPIGSLNGGFIDEQLPLLREDGLEVGLLLHGSELRDPRRHMHRPYSPYAVDDDLTRRMKEATARLRSHLEGLEIPTFVTTPDLLQDIEAEWLPVVVDVPRWANLTEPFTTDEPIILHLPSRGRLKGSEYIDPVLNRLAEDGLIRYLRPEGRVDPSDVPKLVEQADIVIDGIVIGAYGVMSCQALAAGRISIANLSELGPLRQECPIVEADPGSLEAVLKELLADRESWAERSAAGREFVSRYHDGSRTAEVLRPFLGLA